MNDLRVQYGRDKAERALQFPLTPGPIEDAGLVSAESLGHGVFHLVGSLLRCTLFAVDVHFADAATERVLLIGGWRRILFCCRFQSTLTLQPLYICLFRQSF